MSAEIVVIVENQNTRAWTNLFTIKISGRQPADATSYNDQIVGFSGVCWLVGFPREITVAHPMGGFECAGMASPQSSQGGWVITWRILAGRGGFSRQHARQPGTGQQPARPDRHAVQEIAPRNVAVHSKFAVPSLVPILLIRIPHVLCTPQLFLHRSIRLVDGGVGICAGTGIGIRNRDSPKFFPSDHTRALIPWPCRIGKGIVFVGVAVAPSIYGDGSNISRRIESAGR